MSGLGSAISRAFAAKKDQLEKMTPEEREAASKKGEAAASSIGKAFGKKDSSDAVPPDKVTSSY